MLYAPKKTVYERHPVGGVTKISDIGRVFSCADSLTAFVPGTCSLPVTAWEREGRAALPLSARLQPGRTYQAGHVRAEPGHECNSYCFRSASNVAASKGFLPA